MPRKDDEALCQRIREKFDYYKNYWSDIYDEGKKDMKYISGDPWDPKERAIREENNRPVISTDELGQYINQLNNSVRQNKRSAKVIPLGDGANDDTATFITGMIRGIEYKSNAQSAYQCAFENAASRSYGFFRITKEYLPKSCNLELKIKRIPNPDAVYMDPDCKEIDCSDAEGCFIVDLMRREDFKRRFPKAEIQDFTPEEVGQAVNWFPDDKHVQVAEFIEVQHEKRTLIEFSGPQGAQCEYLDEIPDSTIKNGMLVIKGGGTYKVTNQRDEDTKRIVNYFTNGLEILDETEWEGKYIPVIPVFGKEIYVDEGAGAKRVLLSLIRLARDPYMLYCYYRSAEAEVISITPKTPFVGAVGQFKTDKEAWDTAAKIPHPYLQYDAVTDAAGTVLPAPERPKYEPQIQPLEVGAEAMKRQIQSSIGMYNTSVGRSDTKATSGIAIGKLDEQSSEGTFHFIDNYDMALKHGYKIIVEMIPYVYDSARQVALVDEEDNFKVSPITVDQKSGEVLEHFGNHGVTIDTGPSYQSQRDEANQFLESLTKIPQMFATVADLLVKSKNLGPMGDKIAERLTPPQFQQQDGQPPVPPHAQQAIQKGQQENQALHAWAQKLEGELQQLKQREEAKAIQMETTLKIAEMTCATRIRVAELAKGSKVDAAIAQAGAEKDLAILEATLSGDQQAHDQAHEAGMQAVDNAHDQNMADQTAGNQQVLAGQAQAAAAAQASQQPAQ